MTASSSDLGNESMSEAKAEALEAAARALSELHIEASLEKGSGWRVAARRGARAPGRAVGAGLARHRGRPLRL